MKNILRRKNGITLIALVITIIVLLILAGVAIAMLSGENGILSRATETRSANAEAQADEQAKLAYMGVKTDIIAERVSNANYNASTEENTEKLGQKVKQDLDPKNTNTPWNVDYGTAGTITMTFTDSSLNNTKNTTNNHQIVYTIELPGAGGTGVTLKKDGTEINSGGSGSGETTPVDPTPTETVTGVDFGTEKTATTIEVGEDLSIGTEQFRVLNKTSSEIIAVPFYNITLVTPEENDGAYPVQTTTYDDTTKTIFADSDAKYWQTGEDPIDMDGHTADGKTNKIQKYIKAYSDKLKSETDNKVTARAGMNKEMINSAITLPTGSSVTKAEIRNPGNVGNYWLGSGFADVASDVYYVSGRYIQSLHTNHKYHYMYYAIQCGVRPVIVIDIS